MVIPKNKLIDLKYDQNNYTIMVMFFGRHICATFRDFYINTTSSWCVERCRDFLEVLSDSVLSDSDLSDSDRQDELLFVSYELTKFTKLGILGAKYLRFALISHSTTFTDGGEKTNSSNDVIRASNLVFSFLLMVAYLCMYVSLY